MSKYQSKSILINLRRWYRTTWLGHPLVFCPKCKTMPGDWNEQRFVYNGDILISFFCPRCKIRFESKDGIFLEAELKKAYKDIFGVDPL